MITLTKDMGPADLPGVSRLQIGVSWDTTAGSSGGFLGKIKKNMGTDLDLIAIAMSGQNPVRLAGLDSSDPMGNGSMMHSGDNQTGKGEGDDETVTLDFGKIPSPVTSVVFLASAHKRGSSFQKARNISFKVYDGTGGSSEQVADIWPSLLSNHNTCAIAKAVRTNDPSVWTLQVLEHFQSTTQGDEMALMRFARDC